MEFGTGQDDPSQGEFGHTGRGVPTDPVPTRQAANRLKISEKHLRHLARTGQVPCRRLGNEWRFFEAWLIWMTTWTPPAPGEPFWTPPVRTPEKVPA